eukprot:scaffold12435_cov51-Attheya_sp.AAC.1
MTIHHHGENSTLSKPVDLSLNRKERQVKAQRCAIILVCGIKKSTPRFESCETVRPKPSRIMMTVATDAATVIGDSLTFFANVSFSKFGATGAYLH